MSDSVESTTADQNPEPHDRPLPATAAAETVQATPESSEASNVAAVTAAPEKRPNARFSVWPPSDRTREAVRNRLIETLSSPSILSNRYGTISREEAVDAAKLMEEEAFHVAVAAAKTSDGDGVEILQVYAKDISKRMLEKVKAGSGNSEAAPPATTEVNEPPPIKAVEDAPSTMAPPQSEKSNSVGGDE
ncbi:MFP1 attachment factor 1-like [Andrographis paniculata]|uniref:MFP1 attachment factor 1-like n=1 Tax=Andrographis paniculata TaxID=175694 RepID=UPI0021E6FB94|nr:MFP1 attachment factor 1-like [Andrographis paniculata]